MNDDQTLSDTSPDKPAAALSGLADAAMETILSLDEIMSSARLVERTVRICIRGDLEAEYEQTVNELGTLVDANGEVLTKGDQALSDGSRAQELAGRVQDLEAQMKAASRTVRFRAMPDDDWRAFLKTHEDAAGKVKDYDAFNEQIIARCAISPTLTVEGVRAMRKKLTPTQMTALANGAYWACTTGGVDVPKSPSFSPAPRPSSQSGS